MSATAAGRIVYVMGPSGAGKDTLLSYARARLGARVMFAHRYITRPLDMGENHIALTDEEFNARLAHGMFSLNWESHGLHYGIGIEIDAWLARSLAVVVNGSRQHALATLKRYPDARFVHVDAAPEMLAARLAGRARESAVQIAERLLRRPAFVLPAHAALVSIDNSGALADAGQQLVSTIAAAADEALRDSQCGVR